MSVTIDELLALVGRLDDAPGFDTPRERYRRFLLDRVTDVAAARALIEDCQRSVGEQRHRALQDLVVLVGRFLQFEITFGTYDRAAGGVDGQWRSPGLVAVVLEVRTEQTSAATLEKLASTVSGTPARSDIGSPIGLCIVARQYAARGRLANSVSVDTRMRDIRVVSVQSLLALAAQLAAERISHAEVVKLLRSGFALDFVIDLLDRPGAGGTTQSDADADRVAPEGTDRHEPAYWVATIGNESGPPDQMLRSVIAHRRVLAISHAGRFRAEGMPGDWVCFFVPATGIVGHAQLAEVIDDAAGVVRHGSRFSRVYRLEEVKLYERPVVEALRAERPFAVPPMDVPLSGACLAPIAKQDFLTLTTDREGAAAERRRSAIA